MLDILKKLWSHSWLRYLVVFVIGLSAGLIYHKQSIDTVTELSKQRETSFEQQIKQAVSDEKERSLKEFQQTIKATQNNVVTVITEKKPDGTVTTKTVVDKTVQNENQTVKTEIVTKEIVKVVTETKIQYVEKIVEKEKIVTMQPDLPRYMLGSQVISHFMDVLTPPKYDYSFTGGVRLFGDLWGTVGYRIKTKEVSVGLGITF